MEALNEKYNELYKPKQSNVFSGTIRAPIGGVIGGLGLNPPAPDMNQKQLPPPNTQNNEIFHQISITRDVLEELCKSVFGLRVRIEPVLCTTDNVAPPAAAPIPDTSCTISGEIRSINVDMVALVEQLQLLHQAIRI